MPFNLADSTANTQRLAIDNSSNVELGAATPASPLSVSGHPILDGAFLSQRSVSPVGMARVTGAVSVPNNLSTVTVSCPTAFGLSGVDGGGAVVSFAADRSSFELYTFNSGPTTLSYGVF